MRNDSDDGPWPRKGENENEKRGGGGEGANRENGSWIRTAPVSHFFVEFRGAGDRFGDYLCVDCANFPLHKSGHKIHQTCILAANLQELHVSSSRL